MYKFINKNQVPPSGYQFKDPDTGVILEARCYDHLIGIVREHRIGNGLEPIPEADIQHQNCSRLSPSAFKQFCKSDDPAHSVDSVRLHATDVARGTMAILRFKLAGSPLVSREEAERRAAICEKCPFNAPYRMPCAGMCGELLEVVKSIVGGERTSNDVKLHACAVCKCSLAAKVHVPLEILRKSDTEEIANSYPSTCWMIKRLS